MAFPTPNPSLPGLSGQPIFLSAGNKLGRPDKPGDDDFGLRIAIILENTKLFQYVIINANAGTACRHTPATGFL
jgi:hypothetical protein